MVRRMLGVTDDVGAADGSNPREPLNPVASSRGDCGFSEEMHDGYVLWVICDRVMTNANGTPYLRDANLGFAPDSAPTQPFIRNYAFLGSASGPGPCPSGYFRWPTGLTSFPGPTADQTVVVVFYLKGCRDDIFRDFLNEADDSTWDPGTTGVATFVYETGDGAAGPFSPFPEVTVHGPIWDGRFTNGEPWVQHGSGAVYSSEDGYVYAYACSRDDVYRPEPQMLLPINGSGQCTLARAEADAADISALADRARWQYWSRNGGGGTWASCTPCGDAQLQTVLANQKPLDMPGTQPSQFDQHYQVVYSEQLDSYVSVHQRRFDARHAKMVIRVADNPVGPWSRAESRSFIPINCNGRSRTINPGQVNQYTAFNCYQIRPHPALGPTPVGSTVFGYYDTFLDPFPVPSPAPDPTTTPVQDAIRFAQVPLCVRTSPTTSASVDYVTSRCLMEEMGTDWQTATVTRREAASILWRLDGWNAHAINSATEGTVPRAYREPVSFVLDDSRDLAPFWPQAADFAGSSATTRGEFLQLLHRSVVPVPSGYPNPAGAVWNTTWDVGLKQALRWAYGEGLTCATDPDPFQPLTRAVAAAWSHGFKVHSRPCSDGP